MYSCDLFLHVRLSLLTCRVVATCLRHSWSKSSATELDNDVTAYFESVESSYMPDLSIYRYSGSSCRSKHFERMYVGFLHLHALYKLCKFIVSVVLYSSHHCTFFELLVTAPSIRRVRELDPKLLYMCMYVCLMPCSVPSSVSTPPSSPEGSLAGCASSEQESESSRGTVSEKHTHEYKEKDCPGGASYDNGVMMDTSDNSNVMLHSFHGTTNTPNIAAESAAATSQTQTAASQLSSIHRSTSLGDVKSIPCKRGSDTSPSEIAAGDQQLPALPRKKKLTASPVIGQESSSDESIHMPETTGYSIKEFMDYTRIKGRQGLIRQYEQIKGTPPKGSFDASR